MALKKKRIVGIALLAALLVGGVYLYFNANAMIVRTAERVASNALGVGVDIGSIRLSWANRTVTVDGLKIDNPPGYHDKHIMTADSILIGLSTANKQLIDFKNIDVKGSHLYFEMTPQGTNLTDFKKLANSKNQKESAGSEAIRVIVQHMVIDASVIHPRIALLNRDIPAINMPAVRISNIGQKNVGTNAGDVIIKVLSQYLSEAQRAVTNSGALTQLPNMDGARKTLDDTTSKLKNLF